MAGTRTCTGGTRLKLAEWGRAGLKRPRLTRMSVAVLAALVLAVTAAGTAAALTTSSSGRGVRVLAGRVLAGRPGPAAGRLQRAGRLAARPGPAAGDLRRRQHRVPAHQALVELVRCVRRHPGHAVGGQLPPGLRVRALPHVPGPDHAVPGGGPEGRPVLLPDAAALSHGGPREYRYRWATYPGATVPLWVGGPS